MTLEKILDKYLNEGNSETLPEFVWRRVKEEFNRKQEDVYDDIMDVMAGNKKGNEFEQNFAKELMKEYEKKK